jgi:protein-S-isoprenylcysteine O-methyltransferase Ste14
VSGASRVRPAGAACAGWVLAASFLWLAFVRPRISDPGWLAAPIACAGVSFVCLPAWLFAMWTYQQRRLPARAALHAVAYGVVMLGLIPAALHWLVNAEWTVPFERSSVANKLWIQLLSLPGAMLIAAVQEFAVCGGGTPMPSDPPRRLVTTGLYAYVANPMQIGKAGVLVAWAMFWGSPWIAGLALVSTAYSVLIATPREQREMRERFGSAWLDYRRSVRRWWPRWRPCATATSRLYLDDSCRACAELASWLSTRRPTSLRIMPLHAYQGPSSQMVYVDGDGRTEYGISALTRGLERLHFGWACCAAILRLPGIRQLTQLIADGVDPRCAPSPRGECRAIES